MARTTVTTFIEALCHLPLLEPSQAAQVPALAQQFPDVKSLAQELVRRGWLTAFQATQLAKGRAHELLLDQYVLVDLLGQGGMGAVYKARQTRMDRTVALKVIRKECLDSASALDRFRREAKTAARLSHPNVVTVFDSNEVKGTQFLVMEFIEGADLHGLVQKHGRLPVQQSCEYIRQAALGLQHAHEQGLVHRDIKPHNLMVTRQGVVKMMDLGLARAVHHTDASTDLTGTGVVMGTPNYMAPEQSLDARNVDIRADVYSLGCTLYHLLAGEPPFAGMVLAGVLAAHQMMEPKPLASFRPDLPPGLLDVVRRMMAKKPGDRYATPAAVAQALAPFAAGTAATAVTTPPLPLVLEAVPIVEPEERRPRERKGRSRERKAPRPQRLPRFRFVLLALLLSAGILGWYYWQDIPFRGIVQSLLPGKQAVTNSVGMKFVRIPAGKFLMGSPESDRDRGQDEELHEVAITRPFWMGVYEVTQEQYEKVTKENPSRFKDSKDQPVENVSWQEAMEFCEKLSALAEEKKAGRSYRLPTEAEWEYACRGGASAYTPFHYGDALAGDQANCAAGGKGPSLDKTLKVGMYKANAFGLFDMHGNVAEWCADWYGPYDGKDRSDPRGPTTGTRRVWRGGSWIDSSRVCRSAARGEYNAQTRTSYIGFRVVCVMP